MAMCLVRKSNFKSQVSNIQKMGQYNKIMQLKLKRKFPSAWHFFNHRTHYFSDSLFFSLHLFSMYNQFDFLLHHLNLKLFYFFSNYNYYLLFLVFLRLICLFWDLFLSIRFLYFLFFIIIHSPFFMQENINKKVYPGLKVAKYNGQKFGYGLYVQDNAVYASVIGIIQSSTINKEAVYSVSNNLPNKRIGLSIGDIVYAKVLKVKEQQCLVQVLQVNQISCIAKQGKCLEGAIRKENVREKMIDSVIMIECFRPKDIVKAKVISLGDSIRGIYLSTAAQNLGVLVAQHEDTGRLMLPFDWVSMVDPEQLVKEPRKVCKPE